MNSYGLAATAPSRQRVYHSTTWAFAFGDRIVNVTFGERPLGRILQPFEFVLQVATPYPEPPKTLPATSAAPAALCLSCSKFRVTRLLETGDVLVGCAGRI